MLGFWQKDAAAVVEIEAEAARARLRRQLGRRRVGGRDRSSGSSLGRQWRVSNGRRRRGQNGRYFLVVRHACLLSSGVSATGSLPGRHI
jgi:hypothetical protein